jgi:Pretoxin HINT domain
MVYAHHPKTHRIELQPILHVWINHDNDLVDLTLTTTTKTQHGKATTKTSEVIHTNEKHPFLTAEKGFVTVSQLQVGMHVVRAGGGVGVIIGWKLVPGAMTMYNLEVAQDHTFTVGDGQWVVHNCTDNPGGRN